MCRVLAYLGKSISVDELLYETDRSLVKQTFAPHMIHLLNLAGFGMAAWGKQLHHAPLLYKSTALPFFDPNLKNLAQNTVADCLIAHIRGIPLLKNLQVSQHNVHPFYFPNASIALAHNGDLVQFDVIKYDFLKFIHPKFSQYIVGTTDSEWIYALLLTQLNELGNEINSNNMITAVQNTLRIIDEIRRERQIAYTSPVNLFISDGNSLFSTRFSFNFGCYADTLFEQDYHYTTLWYTLGEEYGYFNDQYKMFGKDKINSVIIASEPLTEDVSTWIEVPEYSILCVTKKQNELQIKTVELDIY